MSSRAWPRCAAPHRSSAPREAARAATQRGRPCFPLGSEFAGCRHAARRQFCSQGRRHLINTSYARPAGPQQGLGKAAPGLPEAGRTAPHLIFLLFFVLWPPIRNYLVSVLPFGGGNNLSRIPLQCVEIAAQNKHIIDFVLRNMFFGIIWESFNCLIERFFVIFLGCL